MRRKSVSISTLLGVTALVTGLGLAAAPAAQAYFLDAPVACINPKPTWTFMQIHGSTYSITAKDRVSCHYDFVGAGEKDVQTKIVYSLMIPGGRTVTQKWTPVYSWTPLPLYSTRSKDTSVGITFTCQHNQAYRIDSETYYRYRSPGGKWSRWDVRDEYTLQRSASKLVC